MYKIVMLPSDPIFGDLFKDKQEQKKRSTESYMTFNLNERFATMSNERKMMFRSYAVALFDEKKILDYFHDHLSPNNNLANIDHYEIKWRPEVGPKTGKLHLHALIAIEHHGFFTFKVNDLREDALRYFGHRVYISAPLSSNARVRWLNYLYKGDYNKEPSDV